MNYSKTKRVAIFLFILIGGNILLLSCKKTELLRYKNPKEAIFFKGQVDLAADNFAQLNFRDVKFSFYYEPFIGVETFNLPKNPDTINTVLEYTGDIRLFVGISGKIANYDRPIAFSASGNGRALAILPDSLFLPAGKTDVFFPIRFLSPPPRDTTQYVLRLQLESNKNFDAGRFVYKDENASLASYTFGNNIPKTATDMTNWDAALYGDYSAAKLQAIVEANWQLKGAVIDKINSFIGEKFTGLDYKFFFKFLFYKDYTTRDIDEEIQATIVSRAKLYLQAKKEAGMPIRDQDGKEVVLP
ncbi:MAG: hypothetical protein K0R59_187 [Sphingobacterium sp.]|nr:hypothetical protein [Sphingobacterium sp.]